jgi:ABC-type uncharacterized transport system auxiliary subunit
MKRLLLTLPLIFIGCSNKRVVTNYTLTSYKTKTQNIQKTLSLEVSSSAVLQTKKIYWRKNYEKNPYLYSQWIDDFENLVKKSVYNALFDSGKFKSVYLNKKADINLKLFITNATHVIEKNGSYIILDIKAYANGASKDFYYKIPCEKNAKSAVEAFNSAVVKFEKDLIEWL